MDTGKSIPVIDLRDFPGQSSKLIKACEDLGCFRIINYDDVLPWSLMQEMKSVVRSLLDLPQEIKLRNRDVIAGSGYVPPTEINRLYEALGLYDLASSDAIRDFCTHLDASPQQRYGYHKFCHCNSSSFLLVFFILLISFVIAASVRWANAILLSSLALWPLNYVGCELSWNSYILIIEKLISGFFLFYFFIFNDIW